jgi:hypothetical protein
MVLLVNNDPDPRDVWHLQTPKFLVVNSKQQAIAPIDLFTKGFGLLVYPKPEDRQHKSLISKQLPEPTDVRTQKPDRFIPEPADIDPEPRG